MARRYASLFFVACVDSSDNELITLEIIHHYVEVLDRYFGNVRGVPGLALAQQEHNPSLRPQVCELDIIFSFHKAYSLLDEVLLHGELQEANKREVLRAVTVADEKVAAAQDKSKGKGALASI